MNYVDLIQVGFHGFAFALFYLSFRRFGDISRLEIPQGLTNEELDQRNHRTKMLLGTLKWFLSFSVLFFLLGVGAQLYSKSIQQMITVFIKPDSLPMEARVPLLMKNGVAEPEDALAAGRHDILVVDKDDLTISIDGIIEYLNKLKAINRLETRGRQLNELGD